MSKYKNESDQDIITLYVDNEYTIKQINEEIGVSADKIRRVLLAYGVMRTKTEATRISIKKGRHNVVDLSKYQNHDTLSKAYEARKKKGFAGKYMKDGYVVLNSGKREHVAVVEAHIGRPLKKGEVVHHKNFKRSDNRIENLMLMTNADHATLHRLIEIKMPISKAIEISTSSERTKDLVSKYQVDRHRIPNMKKNKHRYYSLKKYLENERKQSYSIGFCN